MHDPDYAAALRTSQDIVRAYSTRPTPDGADSERWGLYGAGIEGYDASFKPQLRFISEAGQALGMPDVHSIADIVQGIDNPVVVDLMAPTNFLEDLLGNKNSHEVLGQMGIALSLADMRGKQQTQDDSDLGIQLLKGDIRFRRTFQKLRTALGDRQADVIVERAVLGVYAIPPHGAYYGYALGELWKMLKPRNGVMLLQIPSRKVLESAGISIDNYVSQLTQAGIIANVADTEEEDLLSICLIRTADSPEQLPVYNQEA